MYLVVISFPTVIGSVAPQSSDQTLFDDWWVVEHGKEVGLCGTKRFRCLDVVSHNYKVYCYSSCHVGEPVRDG